MFGAAHARTVNCTALAAAPGRGVARAIAHLDLDGTGAQNFVTETYYYLNMQLKIALPPLCHALRSQHVLVRLPGTTTCL